MPGTNSSASEAVVVPHPGRAGQAGLWAGCLLGTGLRAICGQLAGISVQGSGELRLSPPTVHLVEIRDTEVRGGGGKGPAGSSSQK